MERNFYVYDGDRLLDGYTNAKLAAEDALRRDRKMHDNVYITDGMPDPDEPHSLRRLAVVRQDLVDNNVASTGSMFARLHREEKRLEYHDSDFRQEVMRESSRQRFTLYDDNGKDRVLDGFDTAKDAFEALEDLGTQRAISYAESGADDPDNQEAVEANGDFRLGWIEDADGNTVAETRLSGMQILDEKFLAELKPQRYTVHDDNGFVHGADDAIEALSALKDAYDQKHADALEGATSKEDMQEFYNAKTPHAWIEDRNGNTVAEARNGIDILDDGFRAELPEEFAAKPKNQLSAYVLRSDLVEIGFDDALGAFQALSGYADWLKGDAVASGAVEPDDLPEPGGRLAWLEDRDGNTVAEARDDETTILDEAFEASVAAEAEDKLDERNTAQESEDKQADRQAGDNIGTSQASREQDRLANRLPKTSADFAALRAQIGADAQRFRLANALDRLGKTFNLGDPSHPSDAQRADREEDGLTRREVYGLTNVYTLKTHNAEGLEKTEKFDDYCRAFVRLVGEKDERAVLTDQNDKKVAWKEWDGNNKLKTKSDQAHAKDDFEKYGAALTGYAKDAGVKLGEDAISENSFRNFLNQRVAAREAKAGPKPEVKAEDKESAKMQTVLQQGHRFQHQFRG